MTDEDPGDGDDETIAVTPIGTVSTPYATRSEAPSQGLQEDAPGTIHLDDAYAAGLGGLEAGDGVVVVWFAHEADRSVVVTDDGRGVFSTRSPARPNPICLTPCTVTRVEPPTLGVRGVDMLDGSPVLDVKPQLR